VGLYDKMRVINMTPHVIRIRALDGRIDTFEPSGKLIRVDEDVATYIAPVNDYDAVRKWTTTLTSQSKQILRELEGDEPVLVLVSWRAGELIEKAGVVFKNVVIASPDTSTFFIDEGGNLAVERITIHSDGRLIE